MNLGLAPFLGRQSVFQISSITSAGEKVWQARILIAAQAPVSAKIRLGIHSVHSARVARRHGNFLHFGSITAPLHFHPPISHSYRGIVKQLITSQTFLIYSYNVLLLHPLSSEKRIQRRSMLHANWYCPLLPAEFHESTSPSRLDVCGADSGFRGVDHARRTAHDVPSSSPVVSGTEHEKHRHDHFHC